MLRFCTILLAALLLLPLTTTPVEAKAPTSAPQVHVVKQGDTLSAIAQRHGLTVKQLKRLNGLNSSRLKLGQKLALDRAAATPAPQASKSSGKKPHATVHKAAGTTADYVVRRDDSRFTIQDLSSNNGTFLNGARISAPVQLRPHDTVTIG